MMTMMKKNNKKGFTLAELLIVIAIIAILIAIAIPAFSASLHSARLQTDHGNIRSAYAIYKTADMLGVIENGDTESEKPAASTTYYFCKDGKIRDSSTAAGKEYELMTKGEGTECDASVGCGLAANSHVEKAKIKISYDLDTDSWAFELEAPTP